MKNQSIVVLAKHLIGYDLLRAEYAFQGLVLRHGHPTVWVDTSRRLFKIGMKGF